MPIRVLPARLANQIAAGEVVERPASIVKELVENSLDAGATSIDVDISQGGAKAIVIKDNGSGIAKDELTLALSRHATSKISCLDDLEQIASLGFRGEALASIASVSRLTLQSMPAGQEQGWQAHAEGRDMQVELSPVAHPVGATVQVCDLFYNTPARRKFLRSEKTEFQHIDELIKRIALCRQDVQFRLRHNGKVVRHFPRLRGEGKHLKRVSAVCGKAFADQCLFIESSLQDYRLSGWIGGPGFFRNQNDLQYAYVNGRMMRDKLLNHAIREAFEGLIPAEGFPAYVLFFSCDPINVDVNVHPAKHEVRFQQARQVHDFVYASVHEALQQQMQVTCVAEEPSAASEYLPATSQAVTSPPVNHDYITPLRPSSPVSAPAPSAGASYRQATSRTAPQSAHQFAQAANNYQALMTPAETAQDQNAMVFDGQGVLLDQGGNYWWLPKNPMLRAWLESELTLEGISQPLLLPVAISNADPLPAAIVEELAGMGLVLQARNGKLVVKAVPPGLRWLNWGDVLSSFCQNISSLGTATKTQLIAAMADAGDFSKLATVTLWQHWQATYGEALQNRLQLEAIAIDPVKLIEHIERQ